MSKLQRTEADLHLPKHHEALDEVDQADHPRKEAQPEGEKQEEEKGQHSGSPPRHPLSHRVKKIEDVLEAVRKKKYLPYSDSILTTDVYFQPIRITDLGEKGICTVEVEELLNGGDGIKHDIHEYSILASDLLKMLYLVEKADSLYYNIGLEDYDLWKVHRFSEFMEEDRTLEMRDDARISDLLMKKKDYPFALGRGSHLEVYFQIHFVHEYTNPTGLVCNSAKNPNQIVCKAIGKGKFEYCIEARIFMLSDEIHERRLADLLGESQPV